MLLEITTALGVGWAGIFMLACHHQQLGGGGGEALVTTRCVGTGPGRVEVQWAMDSCQGHREGSRHVVNLNGGLPSDATCSAGT